MDNSINPELNEKVIYSAFKLMLYDNQIRIDLYEPELDFSTRTFHITNIETKEVLNPKINPDKLRETFGKYYYRILSNNCSVLYRSIKNGLISPDDLFKIAKSNNGSKLDEIYDKTCETDPELIESEKRFEERWESYLNKSSKEKVIYSRGNSSYCPRCQENPCMCSDPDPD